jgi:CCR4-NOT transcription complex subunit 2
MSSSSSSNMQPGKVINMNNNINSSAAQNGGMNLNNDGSSGSNQHHHSSFGLTGPPSGGNNKMNSQQQHLNQSNNPLGHGFTGGAAAAGDSSSSQSNLEHNNGGPALPRGYGGSGGVGGSSSEGGGGLSSSLNNQNSSNSNSNNANSNTTNNNSSSNNSSAISGDYGLLGLLGVIRTSDADRNQLALGSDLTTLGLNLNSTENLYRNFSSPWSEAPTTREPQFQLPMCYYMQPPALKTGHLSKFQLETLFYIFYALPRDVLQAYAAQELYSREWHYHVTLKLWFKQAGPADGLPNNNNGGFIYFDINNWERRLFNGSMQNITSGLLSEDEVRVKFNNPSAS